MPLCLKIYFNHKEQRTAGRALSAGDKIMKNIRRTEIALYVTLALVSVGTVLSIIQSITKGTMIQFIPMAIIYSTFACGFAAIKREKKELLEENM